MEFEIKHSCGILWSGHDYHVLQSTIRKRTGNDKYEPFATHTAVVVMVCKRCGMIHVSEKAITL